MKASIPADIELSFPYRDLKRRVGAMKSAYLCLTLWRDLSFQAMDHGRSGLYSKGHVAALPRNIAAEAGLTQLESEEAVAALIASGMVKVLSNGDWHCPIFAEYNPHLDADFVPPTKLWQKEWKAWVERMAHEQQTLSRKIPETAKVRQDGTAIDDATLNRALVLIRTLHQIFQRPAVGGKLKPAKSYDIGSIHAAVAIVERHRDAKLSAALKRMLSMNRPRAHPEFPRTVEEALQCFEDLLCIALPDEGFAAWERRSSSNLILPDSKDEKEAQPDQIRDELAKAD